MTDATRTDQTALFACAALLDQGQRVDALSRVLTLAALLGIPVAVMLRFGGVAGVLVVAAAIGLVQTWFAARVGLDAALFRHLAASGPLDLAAFDARLQRAGLRPAPAAPRDLSSRIAGARGLLLRQAAMFLLQAAVIATAGAAA